MKLKRFNSKFIYDKQNASAHRLKSSPPTSVQVKLLPVTPENNFCKVKAENALPVIRNSLEAVAIALSNQRHLKLDHLIRTHFTEWWTI